MKLYYAPGACSLASHLALIEAGLSFSIDKTDVRNRKTSTGEDFLALTGGKGYVPALQLDDGTVLCEGTEVRAFCIKHPEDPDRIKAIAVPEDTKALCS